MTRHRILDSLHNISYMQVKDKLVLDSEGILIIDQRYLRDFRRNWNQFSRYDLLYPLKQVLSHSLLMAEFKISVHICDQQYHYCLSNNIPDYLNKINNAFQGIKKMLHTYQDFPELVNIIREYKPIYKLLMDKNKKNLSSFKHTPPVKCFLSIKHPELISHENSPYHKTLLCVILTQKKDHTFKHNFTTIK